MDARPNGDVCPAVYLRVTERLCRRKGKPPTASAIEINPNDRAALSQTASARSARLTSGGKQTRATTATRAPYLEPCRVVERPPQHRDRRAGVSLAGTLEVAVECQSAHARQCCRDRKLERCHTRHPTTRGPLHRFIDGPVRVGKSAQMPPRCVDPNLWCFGRNAESCIRQFRVDCLKQHRGGERCGETAKPGQARDGGTTVGAKIRLRGCADRPDDAGCNGQLDEQSQRATTACLRW